MNYSHLLLDQKQAWCLNLSKHLVMIQEPFHKNQNATSVIAGNSYL